MESQLQPVPCEEFTWVKVDARLLDPRRCSVDELRGLRVVLLSEELIYLMVARWLKVVLVHVVAGAHWLLLRGIRPEVLLLGVPSVSVIPTA